MMFRRLQKQLHDTELGTGSGTTGTRTCTYVQVQWGYTGASAQPTTTQQIYNVMAVASKDLTVLRMNLSRKLILQIISNLRSTINTNRIEEIVPFHLRSYVKVQFAGLFNHSEQDREACARFLSWPNYFAHTPFSPGFGTMST
jgi:hypothetical protein